MLINEGVKELIKKIESKEPTPGGGSVSAMVGALGGSLAMMYQNLSFEKPSFLALDKDIQEQFSRIYEDLTLIREKLLGLAQKDADAYDAVMTAYRLPKEKDEEIVKRQKEIEKTTIMAIEIPFAIIETTYEGLKLLDEIVEYGNKNAISDVGVAAVLLTAGGEGAALNVKINLAVLSETQKNDYLDRLNKIETANENLKVEILAKVSERLL